MSLPRALEKLDDRAMQPLPPHKLTIGIFSNLAQWKKCQLDCWGSLFECQENFETGLHALPTGGFQGFSRFCYVRLRKRGVLKSRIIDSLAVLRVARREMGERVAVS